MMKIFNTPSGCRQQLQQLGTQTIGLVPTMGNLHRGHLSLIQQARKLCDVVVVSIFVNPLQFSPTEDFHSYPRTFSTDKKLCETAGVDILFAPEEAGFVTGSTQSNTFVSVPTISEDLEGKTRPHFFYGVTTIVSTLFNVIQPTKAFFGEKDFQQLHIIRKMVKDLYYPIDIVGVPTVREADGLALSSRNQYLKGEHRQRAPLLFQTLKTVVKQLKEGETHYSSLCERAFRDLKTSGFQPDYVEIRNQHSLAAPSKGDTQLVVLAAARCGPARLIDNMPVVLP